MVVAGNLKMWSWTNFVQRFHYGAVFVPSFEYDWVKDTAAAECETEDHLKSHVCTKDKAKKRECKERAVVLKRRAELWDSSGSCFYCSFSVFSSSQTARARRQKDKIVRTAD